MTMAHCMQRRGVLIDLDERLWMLKVRWRSLEKVILVMF
jgi:hypothetical protein